MPASPPEIPPPAMFAQPWAVKLGFALLLALTLLVGLAFFDHAHRRELEMVSETTAVGDMHFFQSPTDTTRMPAVGATLSGQPLYVAGMNPIEVRDTHLHRVGEDADRGLGIYELSPAATDTERQRLGASGRTFLLKMGANQFVIARPVEGK